MYYFSELILKYYYLGRFVLMLLRKEDNSFYQPNLDNVQRVDYFHNNETKHLLLPLKHYYHMVDLQVFLVTHDDKKIEITQQAGIPYLLSPEELNGKSILVVDVIKEKERMYYTAPGYCLELLEQR